MAIDPFALIILITFLPYIIWFAIWACVTYWVYSDAKRHGMDATIWALVTFFGGVIGVIVYYIMREEHKKPKVVYMPMGYYPPPAYMPPPGYGPPPYYGAPPPPQAGPPDFTCPDCGNKIKNPYNSQSIFCDKCGGTHRVR